MTASIEKPLDQWTPAEVDTVLADFYGKIGIAQFDLVGALEGLHYAVGDSRTRTGYGQRRTWAMTTTDVVETAQTRLADPETPSWKRHEIERALGRYQKTQKALEDLRDQARPYSDEYARRPWTRAWIVLNSNGHAHRSMECSTCFATTQFGWLTDLSGKDEEEIVAALGSDACTVCYPSAPVETAGPRTAFSKEEKADQQAQEKALAEKAAKQEAKIAKSLSLDGSTVKITWTYEQTSRATGDKVLRRGSKEIKTLRAAELWYVEAAAGREYNCPTPEAIAQVLEMIAIKRGTTVKAETERLADKVAKKRRGY